MRKLAISVTLFILAIPAFAQYEVDITVWDSKWPREKKELVVQMLYSGVGSSLMVMGGIVEYEGFEEDEVKDLASWFPYRSPQVIDYVIEHFDKVLQPNEDPSTKFIDALWIYKQDVRLGNIKEE